jgi:hypothetical protein
VAGGYALTAGPSAGRAAGRDPGSGVRALRLGDDPPGVGLDDRVGEEVGAHPLDAVGQLVTVGVDVELEVLADPDVVDGVEAEPGERPFDRTSLRVEDLALEQDVDGDPGTARSSRSVAPGGGPDRRREAGAGSLAEPRRGASSLAVPAGRDARPPPAVSGRAAACAAASTTSEQLDGVERLGEVAHAVAGGEDLELGSGMPETRQTREDARARGRAARSAARPVARRGGRRAAARRDAARRSEQRLLDRLGLPHVVPAGTQVQLQQHRIDGSSSTTRTSATSSNALAPRRAAVDPAAPSFFTEPNERTGGR